MVSNVLHGTRAYLSGPMDFIGSRVIEKYLGWRAILTPVLKALGITVLDPWNKPNIKGLKNYGREGILPSKEEYEKDFWTNEETRARFETDFWETVHIDCRMVDLSDFVIAFVPTNIYSVGTVHEIIIARNQLKPALLVSPPIKYDFFPEIAALPEEVKQALKHYGLKENPHGIPSQWYGTVVGGNYFFDGFGWEALDFKSDDFYEQLIRTVIEDARPDYNDAKKYKEWEHVKNWTERLKSLQNLKGSVFDHVKIEEGEEELLKEVLTDPKEQQRRYFWYNTPYTPKRSILYQLFSIGSGIIPTRLQMVSAMDEDGNLNYISYKTIDDSWLLFSHEEEIDGEE